MEEPNALERKVLEVQLPEGVVQMFQNVLECSRAVLREPRSFQTVNVLQVSRVVNFREGDLQVLEEALNSFGKF